MRKIFLASFLLVSLFIIPQTGNCDGFWFGFGMSNGYGYGGGFFGGGCDRYVPVAPVVPVVPYYGGCSTTIINRYTYGYGCGPVYHYHPYYPNWFDQPYYGRYYYGGAYHPAPPPQRYSLGYYHARRRARVNINNCNKCNIYGKRYRRYP